jgi:GNAT superfamily N-acetyltransferase
MLRLAQLSDAEEIAALHTASWRNTYRGALSDEYLSGDVLGDRIAVWTQRLREPRSNQYVTVACDDQTLLGFACAYLNEDPRWGSLLDNIHVGQRSQRRGVGAMLLHAVAQHCKKESTGAGLYLWVLQSNVGAQEFYYSHRATNAEEDVWDAPGGTRVPRFRFAWQPDRLPIGA